MLRGEPTIVTNDEYHGGYSEVRLFLQLCCQREGMSLVQYSETKKRLTEGI